VTNTELLEVEQRSTPSGNFRKRWRNPKRISELQHTLTTYVFVVLIVACSHQDYECEIIKRPVANHCYVGGVSNICDLSQ
jgi:hypothetical protein